MVPILRRIRARSIDDFGEPLKHAGEEFVYVLEGSIEVHLQFYTSVILTPGREFTSTAPWATPMSQKTVTPPWCWLSAPVKTSTSPVS